MAACDPGFCGWVIDELTGPFTAMSCKVAASSFAEACNISAAANMLDGVGELETGMCAAAAIAFDNICEHQAPRWQPLLKDYVCCGLPPSEPDPANNYTYTCSSGGSFAAYDARTLTEDQREKALYLWSGKIANYYACVQGCGGDCNRTKNIGPLAVDM